MIDRVSKEKFTIVGWFEGNHTMNRSEDSHFYNVHTYPPSRLQRQIRSQPPELTSTLVWFPAPLIISFFSLSTIWQEKSSSVSVPAYEYSIGITKKCFVILSTVGCGQIRGTTWGHILHIQPYFRDKRQIKCGKPGKKSCPWVCSALQIHDCAPW